MPSAPSRPPAPWAPRVQGGSFAVPCPPGHFFMNNSCKACPSGTFQDEPGQTACKICPEATFTEHDGVQSPDQCLRNHTTRLFPHVLSGEWGLQRCAGTGCGPPTGSSPASSAPATPTRARPPSAASASASPAPRAPSPLASAPSDPPRFTSTLHHGPQGFTHSKSVSVVRGALCSRRVQRDGAPALQPLPRQLLPAQLWPAALH